MNYDHDKYPMVWRKVSTRGYCFTAEIPCRILEIGQKRVKISALLAKGGEKETFVKKENLRHDPCHCFGECRALELFERRQKAAQGQQA